MIKTSIDVFLEKVQAHLSAAFSQRVADANAADPDINLPDIALWQTGYTGVLNGLSHYPGCLLFVTGRTLVDAFTTSYDLTIGIGLTADNPEYLDRLGQIWEEILEATIRSDWTLGGACLDTDMGIRMLNDNTSNVYLIQAELTCLVDVGGHVYYKDEPKDGTVTEEVLNLRTNTMGGVEFSNPEGLTLTTDNGKDYVATGSLSAMTAEQAFAFWGDEQYAGSLYIAFAVEDISTDNPVVIQGWVDSVESEDYTASMSGSTAKGKNLAITLGSAIRQDLEHHYIWKCELTNGEVYTLDLTAQADEAETAVHLSINTMGGVKFGNPSDLSLTTEDGINYKAVGSLSEMTAEQTTAFGWAEEYIGSRFISVWVKAISAENPVKIQGWVSSIDSEDYLASASGSTAKGKNLAISYGSSIRADLNGCYIWKCELADGQVFTVDLTDQASALEEG